jgi:murein DD-endopeptidase MepM/ murein hydrolase activator NlpD
VVEFQLPKLTARVRFPLPALILSLGRGCAAVVVLVFVMTGCSTVPKQEVPVLPLPPVAEKPQGIYHKVAKQESLWRISKTYGVSLDAIVAANNIPNAAVIEENQLVFIPGAKETLKVVLDKTDDKPDEFAWPLKGRVISFFNDPKGQGVNRGIDITAAQGEQILAARDGKVVMSQYLSGYGDTVILDHQDGYYSVYAHQEGLAVKPGQDVSKGTPLGRLAKSGRSAHLHFQIRKMDEPTNPLHYLP